MVDSNPTDTQFEVATGLTQVSILDFDIVRFINFEAEINYPEEEGIVQVENFGMHLSVDGSVYYGMKIEAILNRKADDISLDLLSRLFVDVQQDSSKIVNDLLSAYQRSLLEMIFTGDATNRGKMNLIFAEAISPQMDASSYMDRSTYENELKQIIGDVQSVTNISSMDLAFLGRDGIIFAGPNCRKHERLIMAHFSLLVREVFIRNFFVRTFILDDSLKRIRALIMTHEKDPNNIPRVRTMLNEVSRQTILLQEILSYLAESLEELPEVDDPTDAIGTALFRTLRPKILREEVQSRVKDLEKLVHGANAELGNLAAMTDVINTKQLEEVFKGVEANTKSLVDASAATERASASLQVMQVILAGSFAFAIVDRISGGTLGVDVPQWVVDFVVTPIISVPGLWFALNIGWLVLFCTLLILLMRFLERQATGFLSLRIKPNVKVDVAKLESFLAKKAIEVSDVVTEPLLDIKKVTWKEDDSKLWKGPPPRVEITYDRKNGFLLSMLFQLDKKKSKLTEEDVIRTMEKELKDTEIIVDELLTLY